MEVTDKRLMGRRSYDIALAINFETLTVAFPWGDSFHNTEYYQKQNNEFERGNKYAHYYTMIDN